LVMWRAFCSEDGGVSELPWHMLITSRQHGPSGTAKQYHFALVCERTEPLLAHQEHIGIDAACARNLVSNERVGSSQVTAVVKYYPHDSTGSGYTYPVLFRATLARQSFIRLVDPVSLEGGLEKLYEAACRAGRRRAVARRIYALKRAAAIQPVGESRTATALF